MSLASPMGRVLSAQALSLAEFLAAHNHSIDAADALRVCASLDEDPKSAARELKPALEPLGVSLKHTHALKAVADMRHSESFLGLASGVHWDIASWVDDAMGVGANRKLHSKLGAASDDLCRRLRDQFEPQHEPWVMVVATPVALELRAIGTHSTCWRSVLVATNQDGEPCEFPLASLQRLGERLRRLVEGELFGWLDGCRHLQNGTRAENVQFHTPRPGSEWAILRNRDGTQRSAALDGALQKRIDAFDRRHDQSLGEWLLERESAAAGSQFAPVGLDVARLEIARVQRNGGHADLAVAANLSQQDWENCLNGRHLPARAFKGVADALHISPNDLLVDERKRPSIPLPRHNDIGAWLSRLDAVVAPYDESSSVLRDLAKRLGALCATRFGERADWDRRPPRELKDLNQQLRFAGFVVSATMGVRFVQDLPLGHTRLAGVSIFSFDTEEAVLTQGGLLELGNAAMNLPAEEESVSAEWLARFNAPRFTGEDLMRYGDVVNEMRDPDEDDDGRFHTTIHAAVKAFPKDSPKGHAATVRMEALSRLITSHDLDPWVVESAEADHSMISKPAFHAAAACPLIDVDGKPGFDFRAFYMLCVENTRAGES